MKYLLGIDFGGGASKATLLSEEGVVCATNTTEYKTDYPKPGYAEQNPDDWYNAVISSIKEIISKGYKITGIGVSGQMHGLVLLDEYEIKPVRKVLVPVYAELS